MLRSRRGTKNMSDRDHWYRIWNILFEEAPKTKSIYLGNWQSEVIEASRQFMNQEGVAIIIRQLGRDDARWKNDEELKTRLEKALSKVFDDDGKPALGKALSILYIATSVEYSTDETQDLTNTLLR
ncbi:hypothetical protein CEP52_011276 [Fusarium oligoseptatum]|uniref:Uncharacterized protein n=1 Tax=Fusarium oligoseptatum TaxID=2604345 RepID=A0A428T427_9HYPO|nr:hypothetical protein CEP52_011276 [Fusarium oligoseptatum]